MEVVGDMVDVIIDVLCEVTVSEVVVWVFVDVQGDVVVVELDEISQNSPVHSGGQTQFILPNKNEQSNFSGRIPKIIRIILSTGIDPTMPKCKYLVLYKVCNLYISHL